MNEREYFAPAHDLFQEAYESQMEGELEAAIELYQRSIEAYPTAEAHTYLGWTYSFQGKLDEAIEECKKAISIDPDFGNPYNDIGSYLIQKAEYQEPFHGCSGHPGPSATIATTTPTTTWAALTLRWTCSTVRANSSSRP